MLKIKHIASKLALLLYLLIFVFAGYFAYSHYKTNLQDVTKEVKNRLSLDVNIQKESLEKYYATMESEIIFLAQTGSLKLGLDTFKTTWAELGKNASLKLRLAYIENNPFKERSKLLNAKSSITYDILHEAMHVYLRELQQMRRYEDILLLDMDGNVIYSVQKRDNFAKNVKDIGGNLQKIFKKIHKNSQKESIVFEDFGKDGKSYIATAIVDEMGDKIGIVAFELGDEVFEKYSVNRLSSKEDCKQKSDQNSTHFLAFSCLEFKDNYWGINEVESIKKVYAPVKEKFYELLKIFIILAIFSLALSYLVLEKLLGQKDEDE